MSSTMDTQDHDDVDLQVKGRELVKTFLCVEARTERKDSKSNIVQFFDCFKPECNDDPENPANLILDRRKKEDDPSDPSKKVWPKGTRYYVLKTNSDVFVNPDIFVVLRALTSPTCMILQLSGDVVFQIFVGTNTHQGLDKATMLKHMTRSFGAFKKRLLKYMTSTVSPDKDHELPEALIDYFEICFEQFTTSVLPLLNDNPTRNYSSTPTAEQRMHFLSFPLNPIEPWNQSVRMRFHRRRLCNAPSYEANHRYFVLAAFSPEILMCYHLMSHSKSVSQTHVYSVFKSGEEYARWVFRTMQDEGIWEWNNTPGLSSTISRLRRGLTAAAVLFFHHFIVWNTTFTPQNEERFDAAQMGLERAMIEVWRVWRPGLWRNPDSKNNKDWEWFIKIGEDHLFNPLLDRTLQMPIWLADRIGEDAAARGYSHTREPRNFKLAPKTGALGYMD